MATASAVAAIVAAAAGVVSVVQQRRAAKEQRRQNEITNRIAATRRMRSIRQAIAQSRIQRAEIQSQGFQFGVSGGTAVAGSTGATQADLAGSIGASNQQFTGQQAVIASQNRISSLTQSAATFSGISSIAGQFAGGTGQQNFAAIQGLV